jgi:hypothetical protein
MRIFFVTLRVIVTLRVYVTIRVFFNDEVFFYTSNGFCDSELGYILLAMRFYVTYSEGFCILVSIEGP